MKLPKKITVNNFCSHKCAASFQNKQRKLSNYTTKGKLTQKYCVECNAECIVPINHPIRQVKCSDCKNQTKSKYKSKITPFISKLCLKCASPFTSKFGKYCDSCRKEIAVESGRRAALACGKRSKNEIHFAKLCKNYGLNILENFPMFDGWDADVIIPDLKIAILWNGPWHYRKITDKHSLKQVQKRDEIKLNKIKDYGYTAYIIRDDGSRSPQFVEEKFKEFVVVVGVEPTPSNL